MSRKPLILLIDMDNVLVNFDASPRIPAAAKQLHDHPAIQEPGFFDELLPLPGAIQAVNALLDSGLYDIYICTQPVWSNSNSYMEKADWIAAYLPRLSSKIIMTQNKCLIKGYFLIDDNLKWRDFGGIFIHFDHKNAQNSWRKITDSLVNRGVPSRINFLA
jgi:5'(3')-deoxyribonucleotidase